MATERELVVEPADTTTESPPVAPLAHVPGPLAVSVIAVAEALASVLVAAAASVAGSTRTT